MNYLIFDFPQRAKCVIISYFLCSWWMREAGSGKAKQLPEVSPKPEALSTHQAPSSCRY